MAKFVVRRVFLMLVTMLLVSMAVFAITESSPGNVARNLLGSHITPEQEASLIAQMGLNQPLYTRYAYWLLGSDWRASNLIGLPVMKRQSSDGFVEWWAELEDGRLARWKLSGNDLVIETLLADGTIREEKDEARWQKNEDGSFFFWGLDNKNRAVKWIKGGGVESWTYVYGVGMKKSTGAPVEYLPLKRGILRADAGISLRTGRPVSKSLLPRVRNSIFLAAVAFIIIMPLAVLLGIITGLREGTMLDRVISSGGMMVSVVPEFVTGIFLILIFSGWLKWLPGAAAIGNKAPWEVPLAIVLPVLTLTMSVLGYVLRITRASIVEVMRAAYIRTAYLKGLTNFQVIWGHAIRNALIAPITVIMLHVSWMLGGIVIVEVVFGYPGLGVYLLDSALYKDINAIEAGTMIMVATAVGTQLVADIIYSYLNPRIRYS